MKIVQFLMIYLILSLGVSTGLITTSQENNEDTQVITGYLPPNIDGIIAHQDANYLGTQYLDEWADSVKRDNIYVSTSGDQYTVLTRSKYISDTLYIALESFDSGLVSSVSDIYLQIDLDKDQTLSNGDFKIGLIDLESLQYEVYLDGNWEDVASLSNNILLAFLADVAYVDSNKIVSNTVSYFSAEIQFNTKFARNLMGGLGIEIDVQPAISDYIDTIGYGVYFRENDGSLAHDQTQELVSVNQDFALSNLLNDRIDIDFPDIFEVDVGIDHIEVTQAVQYENNTLPLIQRKQTLARVFIDQLSGSSQLVLVKLYAFTTTSAYTSLGMMSQVFVAPSNPERSEYNDSANFELPAYWENRTGLILKAEVTPIAKVDPNSENNSQWFAKELLQTHDMVIYNIRLNLGNLTHPDLLDDTHYNALQMWLEHTYPTNPNFINYGWETLGPFVNRSSSMRDNYYYLIMDLNAWYYEIKAMRTLAVLFGVPEDAMIPVPDQLFASTTWDVGLSNPSWHTYANGFPTTSAVTHGGPGSPVLDRVMAHEINHNILNNNSGRHAPECGAGGPDPTWEENTGSTNTRTGDIGWSPANRSMVVDLWDFMSYCGFFSGLNPSNWVSAYRWQELTRRFLFWEPGNPIAPDLFPSSTLNVNYATFPNSLDLTPDSLHDSTMRIVSGIVSQTEPPVLEPTFSIPGITEIQYPVYDSNIHTHYLEVSYANNDPIQIGFGPFNFNDIDNNPIDILPFTIPIQDNGEITKVEIFGPNGQVALQDSGSFVSLSSQDITSPQTVDKGKSFEISWPANYQNNTNIYAQLRYSPDGNNWFKIGTPTTDNSIETMIDRLPGSLQGQFQLLFSDGFATSSIDIPVQVQFNAPSLKLRETDNYILSANGYEKMQDIITLPLGSELSLSADARNDMGMTLDDITWSINSLGTIGSNTDIITTKFSQVGEYLLTVSVTDPTSSLSTSIEITIIVETGVLIERSSYEDFQQALIDHRDQTNSEPNNNDQPPSDESDGFFNNPLNISYYWILAFIPVLMLKFRKEQ